jgi:hypothetical protein
MKTPLDHIGSCKCPECRRLVSLVDFLPLVKGRGELSKMILDQRSHRPENTSVDVESIKYNLMKPAKTDLSKIYPKYNCPKCGDWFHMPYKYCKCDVRKANLKALGKMWLVTFPIAFLALWLGHDTHNPILAGIVAGFMFSPVFALFGWIVVSRD